MLATSPTPFESLAAPRVHSAGDLCKAMLGVAGSSEPLVAAGLDRTLRHDAEHGLLEVQSGVA